MGNLILPEMLKSFPKSFSPLVCAFLPPNDVKFDSSCKGSIKRTTVDFFKIFQRSGIK
jgi:hypothetical protein